MNIIELSLRDLRDLLLVLAKVPDHVYMTDPTAHDLVDHLVSTILKMREIDWEAVRGANK